MAVVAENDNVTILQLELNEWNTNAYIVICKVTGESMVVDAPGKVDEILKRMEGTQPQLIAITHGHMDHIEVLAKLRQELQVPVAMHPLDADPMNIKVDIELYDGAVLTIGKLQIDVLHTPGHTKGGVSLLTDNYLITGDTLFPGGPGMTKTPEQLKTLIDTLVTKIFVLPDNTRILPGHGEPTILRKEKREFAVFSSKPHDEDLCGDVLWLTS
jgi:hydroxyacylglutathione hydrolase